MFQSLFKICWSRLSIARADQAADALPQCNEIPSNTYALPAVLPRQCLRSFSSFLLPLLLRRSTSSSLVRLVVVFVLWEIRFTSAMLFRCVDLCFSYAELGYWICHFSWSPQLYGTFVASVGCLHYVEFWLSQLVVTAGYFHYMGSTSFLLRGTLIAFVLRTDASTMWNL